jgi:hypothetical protein
VRFHRKIALGVVEAAHLRDVQNSLVELSPHFGCRRPSRRKSACSTGPQSSGNWLLVAFDGELETLRLHYRIRPGALRVFALVRANG